MESMADAHPRFLVDLLVAHLSDLRQNNRAGSVCGRVKICNFELPIAEMMMITGYIEQHRCIDRPKI